MENERDREREGGGGGGGGGRLHRWWTKLENMGLVFSAAARVC